MVALEHVGKNDINCVTVAVDAVRVVTGISQWKLDEDIEYHRCSSLDV